MGFSMYGQDTVGPNEYTIWDYKFVWWPRTCELSGKRMWLIHAYRGLRVITGPGEPVFTYFWHDAKEHLIWKLKSN